MGLYIYSLINDAGFIESATVELQLYDSGSDAGTRYTSGNEASDPLSPISRVSSGPQDAPFVDGAPVVGTFNIEHLAGVVLGQARPWSAV